MSEERVHEIIGAFDHFDGTYKRAEMEEALTFKEEITPHLIRILGELAADPARYAAEEHYANIYAVALLAHFRELSAHLPIIRAFCIDDESREILWGDMVTETLPALLFLTCNGSLDAIRELVLNKEAYDYVRGSAVDALAYAVARGVADRAEVIGFLSGLFTGTEADENSYLWCTIASVIADLHPEGAMEVIRKAYEDGLVYDGYIGLDEIEKDLLKDKEEVLERLSENVEDRISTDIHDYISRFACFRENEYKPRSEPVNTAQKAQKNWKKANRAKNSMAKKSKRKNRK